MQAKKILIKSLSAVIICVTLLLSCFGVSAASTQKVAVLKSNKKVTPNGGNYINVGSGTIAEIVGYEAETFNAKSTNDYSRPTNNYLPKGTVDYCSQDYIYSKNTDQKMKYVLLRYGKQVYSSWKDSVSGKTIKVVKKYIGTLPDHNEMEIGFLKNGSTHSVLKLTPMWKAPFILKIKPQEYVDSKAHNYRIEEFTATYIDITLCYTTVIKGKLTIPKDNPLFKSAKIIKNKSNDGKTLDYKIRLYLKKKGGFYGWDSYYDKNGNLIFKFLNPCKVKKADNKYGADLTGARILIDVGHGGKDCGALGKKGTKYSEAKRNLILAKKLKKELTSIGATVYMTRTSNVTAPTVEKIKQLKKLKPDYCIAIHHDWCSSSKVNGFGAYYTNPFSHKASEVMVKYAKQSKVYKNTSLKSHYYAVARSSYCPVVLTENGFMSNPTEYKKILSDSYNNKKAKYLTKAIVHYFLFINRKS